MLSNLLIVIITTISGVYGVQESCGHFDAADTCMQNLLMIGNPSFTFPLNKADMANHCGTLTSTEKCVKEYSLKCFDPFSRQITGVLVNGAVKTNKGYCSSLISQEAFISVGECTNARKQTLDQLMYNFIDINVAINTAPQKSMKIPLLCCNFNKFKSNALQVARDGTQPKCTDQVVTEIEKLIDGFADDVLNLICPQEYSQDSGDKCEPIIELTPTKVPNQVRPKSLLMPLVNIFNSLKTQ